MSPLPFGPVLQDHGKALYFPSAVRVDWMRGAGVPPCQVFGSSIALNTSGSVAEA